MRRHLSRTRGQKAAFLTDLHVRDAEIELHAELLARVIEQVRDFAPDVILIGGDLAGMQVPHKATVSERNLIARTVAHLSMIAPVVCARGNHDFPGDYQFLGHFSDVTWIEGDPALVTLDTEPPLAVMVLPWLDRSRFAVGADYRAAVHDCYRAAIKHALPDLRETHEAGGACLLLGHAAIKGATLREGQPEVPTEDPVIDLGELLADVPHFDAGFFGHYHSPQQVFPRHFYGGSLFVNEYGEEPARGWTAWAAHGEHEHRTLVQPRRIVARYVAGTGRIEKIVPVLLATPSTMSELVSEPPERAVLKLVAAVPSPGALAAAREEAAGYIGALAAHEIEAKAIFEVAHVERSREGAEATAAATTMTAKFGHWIGSLDEKPPKVDERRAVELLAEIEAELDKAEP